MTLSVLKWYQSLHIYFFESVVLKRKTCIIYNIFKMYTCFVFIHKGDEINEIVCEIYNLIVIIFLLLWSFLQQQQIQR